MTSKTKTILFASLIAAMILPFSTMDFAEAKNSNTNYDKVSDKLDREIEKFVKQSEKFSNDPAKLEKVNEKFAEKKAKLISQHDVELDQTLGELLGDGYTKLSSDERTEMIEYVVGEKFKAPIHEKFVSDMLSNEEGINVMGFEIVPPAYASCSTQPNVYKFKQLDIDIDGFVGFEGDNDLETVDRDNLSSCLREYVLTFTDEDHPVAYIDANYDILRLYEYGRIQDVETFYVSNGDIWFLDSGSKTQGFLTFYPTHYQEVDSFSNTVYVSNTWNHLMDTSNTNTGDTLKTWYK